MWNVITLDGYFEGKQNWDLSFHNAIWGPELEKMSIEQFHAADYLIFGRVTYEGMEAYWTKEEGEIAHLMNTIPKIVFSKTLSDVHWQNTTLFRGNVTTEINMLKQQGTGDMYVFGSSILSETLMHDNLFDEYRIGIAPVILGNGRPLFKTGIVIENLKLVSSQQLANGGVVLKYAKK